MCNELKEAFSLDQDNCIKCSSGNKNSVIGVTAYFRKYKVHWLPLPFTAHLCAGKGAKELPVNVEYFLYTYRQAGRH